MTDLKFPAEVHLRESELISVCCSSVVFAFYLCVSWTDSGSLMCIYLKVGFAQFWSNSQKICSQKVSTNAQPALLEKKVNNVLCVINYVAGN